MKQTTGPFKIRLCALIAITTALVLPTHALRAATPDASQPFETTAQLCADQTARLEQSEAIPTHLLTAISLVETGRGQSGSPEIFAWPWTVTALGRGQHFDSKEEALAEVEILLTEGVRNIDVGCMQVNLKYHPNAFATLAEALDPKANTRYAARFLKRLHKSNNNWMKAVGAYHSSTPDKNLKYRAKLVRLWNKTRAIKGQPALVIEASVPSSSASRDIDYLRVDNLNKAFQERRKADPVEVDKKDRFMRKAMKRHEELNAWRRGQVQGLEMRHLAEMRRAEQKLRESRELSSKDKPSFEE